MSVYMTEEEQLESIKKWWKRYGNIITLGISVVFLCVAGYRYYNWHEEKITQQASSIYEKMMMEFSSQNNTAVNSFANELIQNYSTSVYADGAHMALAKLYISQDKFTEARSELQWVASKSKIPTIKQIAKIRLARVLAADKSFPEAFNELSNIDDKVYQPVINELKGDIYASMEQYKEAIDSYHLANEEVKKYGIANMFLEMKINDLANKS